MEKLISIIAVLLLAISAPAFASGVTGEGTISYLEVDANGVEIQIVDSSGNLVKADPDACGRDWAFFLDMSNPMFNALFSTILASRTANQNITLKLSGCDGPSGNTWPLISYVMQGTYKGP